MSAAHKTLWGFLRQLAPPPPQEQTRPATTEERHATITGWRHVRGRWFYSPTKNALMHANRRFISAFRKLRALRAYDKP